jgi:hypothetical protein
VSLEVAREIAWATVAGVDRWFCDVCAQERRRRRRRRRRGG